MKKYIWKIRLVLWSILGGVLFFILYQGIVPFGKITYVYDFHKPSRFISKLGPKDRLGEFLENGIQMMIGDPVYFSLRVPRRFDTAKLKLEYKKSSNSEHLPIIQAGVLADNLAWRYDLRPIDNEIINDLINHKWDVIREGDLILLQKEKNFLEINDFLKKLKKHEINQNQVALYNTEVDYEFLLAGYQPREHEEVVSVGLRGGFEFYTYIRDEELRFNFSFVDLNQNDDADAIDVLLYYEDAIIESRHLEDAPGDTLRELNLALANLPEGVYKIAVRANDDIVTREIRTLQSKLSFRDRIQLAHGLAQDIRLYSNACALYFKTIYPENLGNIEINKEEDLQITETYSQFKYKTSCASSTEIRLPRDGFIIASDGAISFGRDALLDPRFRRVDANFSAEDFNYVLARYSPPVEHDGWKMAELDFDLRKAYMEDRKYGFIISVPGMRAREGRDDFVEIRNIEMELVGRSLWEKIFEGVDLFMIMKHN